VISGGYLDIGLRDTMKDLLVNCLGAIIFSFIGVAYLHRRGKGRFIRSFIPRLMTREEMEKWDEEARLATENRRRRRKEKREKE
jgi:hypothetical protein